MNTGIIFNIQKFCLHDGDGIRTCVFLKGCPLECIWCHNPEGLEKKKSLSFNKSKCTLCGSCFNVCSARKAQSGTVTVDRAQCTACGKCTQVCLNTANEIIGREISAEEVISEVLRDKMFYDTSGGGLTVTGGEPSYQPDFALSILRLARENGISAAVETCGIGPREFYKAAADMGVIFLFDIKCMDASRHKELTGADNSHIMSNLQYLMDRGADIIIRLPFIPGCNDSDEDIALLSAFLLENKGRYRYAEIMPYHAMGTTKAERLGRTAEYTHDSADAAAKKRWCAGFEAYGADVRISE